MPYRNPDKRKQKSREAARNRRTRETQIFSDLYQVMIGVAQDLIMGAYRLKSCWVIEPLVPGDHRDAGWVIACLCVFMNGEF